MNDTTGKKLELGQIVDLQLIGMFRGTIVQVSESVIQLPGKQPVPPHIIINVSIPRYMTGPSPEMQCIYVVAEPEAAQQEQTDKASGIMPS